MKTLTILFLFMASTFAFGQTKPSKPAEQKKDTAKQLPIPFIQPNQKSDHLTLSDDGRDGYHL